MMKYCYLCRRLRDLIYFFHPHRLTLYDICSHCRPGSRSAEADARYMCEEMSMDYDGPFGVGPVKEEQDFNGEDPSDKQPFPEEILSDAPNSIKLNKEDFRDLLVEHGIEHLMDDCEHCNPKDGQDGEGHDHDHDHDHSPSPYPGPVFGPEPPPGHKYGHKKQDPKKQDPKKQNPKKQDTKKHDPYKYDPIVQAEVDYLKGKYGSDIDIKMIDPNLPRLAAERRKQNKKNAS